MTTRLFDGSLRRPVAAVFHLRYRGFLELAQVLVVKTVTHAKDYSIFVV